MNDYYPFGMRWYNNGNPLYKYKFGGKELQTELNLNTYDFHARQQDPQLGRFWGVDPMADERVNLSSFNYVQAIQAANNPQRPKLLFVDFNAGHGAANSPEAYFKQLSAEYAFLFWQCGHPDFQTK